MRPSGVLNAANVGGVRNATSTRCASASIAIGKLALSPPVDTGRTAPTFVESLEQHTPD